MNSFLIFHHNLSFSSIPPEHYEYIIDHVYYPLLHMAASGIPMGMEFTGETLETIHRLRPAYIDDLKSLIKKKQVELIGSAYSQTIFPLIPAEVNSWNLSFGLETYCKILGTCPTTAYINEQCYSESIPALFSKAGYRAIIFDWMNALQGHDWPVSWRYVPVLHAPSDMTILWSDSILFQKLQRTVWEDSPACQYFSFLEKHIKNANSDRNTNTYLCLYCSDAEIFDYSPGTLLNEQKKTGAIKRLNQLIETVSNRYDLHICLPSRILQQYSAEQLPHLQSITTPDYPVRTKKQDKYNVTRWAVSGREATRMNTQCFRLLDAIKTIEKDGGEDIHSLKKNLVKLWGSDYRTHTTDEKYEEFRNLMGLCLAQAGTDIIGIGRGGNTEACCAIVDEIQDDSKGITAYEDDFYLRIHTGHTEISLLKKKGLAIERLCFPHICEMPLLGTVPHGYFNAITIGSDFFSGHIILIDQRGTQHTDLSCHVPEVTYGKTEHEEIIIKNKRAMRLPGLSLNKQFRITDRGIEVTYDFYAHDLRPASLRMGIWTLVPDTFERRSLHYSTRIGGEEKEIFSLSGTKVAQDSPVNHIVTARHCIGCTDGCLEMGDSQKKIVITTDHARLYAVPLIHYEEAPRLADNLTSFLCRAIYSICERDDVSNVFWKGHLRLSFFIHGQQCHRDLQTVSS